MTAPLSERVYERFRINSIGWKGDPPVQEVMNEINALESRVSELEGMIRGLRAENYETCDSLNTSNDVAKIIREAALGEKV